jgi:hypothetical protein
MRSPAWALVEDYLELCRNPSKDLVRWIAEDKKRPGGAGRRFQSITSKWENHAAPSTENPVAHAHGLRRQSLPSMQNGLDADGQRGRPDNRLFARSRAGAGRYDRLRPARAETNARLDGPGDTAVTQAFAFKSEQAALGAFYGAKIEALKRSVAPRDLAVALKALFAERSAAFRALADRRQDSAAAARRKASRLRRPMPGDAMRGRDESIPSKPSPMV